MILCILYDIYSSQHFGVAARTMSFVQIEYLSTPSKLSVPRSFPCLASEKVIVEETLYDAIVNLCSHLLFLSSCQ